MKLDEIRLMAEKVRDDPDWTNEPVLANAVIELCDWLTRWHNLTGEMYFGSHEAADHIAKHSMGLDEYEIVQDGEEDDFGTKLWRITDGHGRVMCNDREWREPWETDAD